MDEEAQRMKAITVGSATVDVIASIASDDIERMTLHNSTSSFLLLEPGRKVDAASVVTQVGGGAINAAVSLALQEYDVSALVKLGKDRYAKTVLDRLKDVGIATGLVRTTDADSTAVSVMIASHDKNAAIFTHRGANGLMAPEDLTEGMFDGAGLVYVTNLSKRSVELFPQIVAQANAAGAFVAVNPGILQLTHKTEPFFDALAHIDLFTCNEDEARALVPALVARTGWTPHRTEGAHDDERLSIEGFSLSFASYFARLHDLGTDFIALTRGGNGAVISRNGEIHRQPAIPVEVVGTAGAGDAFASTLAAGLARKEAVEKASKRAALNAASVVGAVDTQSGLLTLEALTKKAAEH